MRTPLARLEGERGFTLLETMIAVVIIAVTLAAVAPNFVSFTNDHKVYRAASQIESALLKARSMAVTRNENVRVLVSQGANLYLIQRDSDGDGAYETFTEWNSLPRNINVADVSFNGNSWVVFNSRGIPSNSGNVTVGSGTSQRQIILSPGSGSVMVTKGYAREAGEEGDGGQTGY